MLKIGKYNTLRVARNVDFGAYLQDADGNEVLLPSRYIVHPLQPGDESIAASCAADIDAALATFCK